MADISTSLPDLDLGPGATITVDVGSAGATVTELVVFGTYYPPGSPEDQGVPAGPFMLVPGPGA